MHECQHATYAMYTFLQSYKAPVNNAAQAHNRCYSENHMKPINTLREESSESFNVKAGGT
jgi:hypothetical protein